MVPSVHMSVVVDEGDDDRSVTDSKSGAKVRQTRAFNLDIVNIQDAGQESWKKKYVYWIPALHLEGRR